MDRKWRLNKAAIDTVTPYDDFIESIPAPAGSSCLASPTDLYAVHTVLHIESKQSVLRWSEEGGFHYFLATWTELTSRPAPEILVPVSSGFRALTPALLHRLFAIRGATAQQLLLALVDENGVVSRTCLYNYIQSPLQGPGTADLDLLDD